MSTYKDSITEAMTELGAHPKTCICGYNVRWSKAGGTLEGFPEDRLFEMPLAESLMTGVAIGMSLDGWVPVLWAERMDFTLIMLDGLVNHLARINELSEGVHRPAAIIRVAVGNSKTPLFTGKVHTQNFSNAFRAMNTFDVIELTDKAFIKPSYEYALSEAIAGRSTMVVEFRDSYNL